MTTRVTDHLCSECGQPHTIQQLHKEVLSKLKLRMLQSAAEHVKSTMQNDFKKNQLVGSGNATNYANFPKLRYHGLITPVRDSQNRRIKGRWLITRNGWAFLRGEIELPKYVLVSDNKVRSRADTLIGVKDVYSGADTIQTNFEYFDHLTGQPIGVFPQSVHTKGGEQTLLV